MESKRRTPEEIDAILRESFLWDGHRAFSDRDGSGNIDEMIFSPQSEEMVGLAFDSFELRLASGMAAAPAFVEAASDLRPGQQDGPATKWADEPENALPLRVALSYKDEFSELTPTELFSWARLSGGIKDLPSFAREHPLSMDAIVEGSDRTRGRLEALYTVNKLAKQAQRRYERDAASALYALKDAAMEALVDSYVLVYGGVVRQDLANGRSTALAVYSSPVWPEFTFHVRATDGQIAGRELSELPAMEAIDGLTDEKGRVTSEIDASKGGRYATAQTALPRAAEVAIEGIWGSPEAVQTAALGGNPLAEVVTMCAGPRGPEAAALLDGIASRQSVGALCAGAMAAPHSAEIAKACLASESSQVKCVFARAVSSALGDPSERSLAEGPLIAAAATLALDEDKFVRASVARGYDPTAANPAALTGIVESLAADRAAVVRQAVAEKGLACEVLANDESPKVAAAAKAALESRAEEEAPRAGKREPISGRPPAAKREEADRPSADKKSSAHAAGERSQTEARTQGRKQQ